MAELTRYAEGFRTLPEHLGDLPTPSGVSRRRFLHALFIAPALASSILTVDWDQLLWVPKPIIVVPALLGIHGLTLDALNAQAMRVMISMIEGQWKVNDPLLSYLKGKEEVIWRPGPPIESPLGVP